MGIREILLKRASLLFTVVPSLITGVVIGYSLRAKPAISISNVPTSLGLTLAWVINLLWGIFEKARQNEKEQNQERIRQESLLLKSLNNWTSKTQFARLYFKDGILDYNIHIDPDANSLLYYDKVVDIFKKCNVYPFWDEAKKASMEFLKKGKNAIKNIHYIVDEATNNVPLNKSLKRELLNEPSFSHINIVKAIFDEIENNMGFHVYCHRTGEIICKYDDNMHQKLYGELRHGTHELARGKVKILLTLKNVVENLILNEKIKKEMDSYEKNKNKLDTRCVFKEFNRRLKKLIEDWELFHEFRPQT